jgi:hypothetical protein
MERHASLPGNNLLTYLHLTDATDYEEPSATHEPEEHPEEESQEQAPNLLDERHASLPGNILLTYVLTYI